MSHVGPLSGASCSGPTLQSSLLTTGTAGKGQGVGRLETVAGDPGTPADDADLRVVASATDVRKASDGLDYTGKMILRTKMRITDRANGVLGGESATTENFNFSFPLDCVATPQPNPQLPNNFGGSCTVTTTTDTLLANFANEGKRAVLSAVSMVLLDARADGTITSGSGTCPLSCGTGDEAVFLRQGVFTP